MRRKPIPFKALTAILRAEITADPFIDNAEWIERTKCTLVRQGWDYPPGELLSTTLQHVERALTRRWGRRPAPLRIERPPPAPDPRPLAHDEAAAILSELGVRVPSIPATQHPLRPMTHAQRLHGQRLQLVTEAIAAAQRRLAALEADRDQAEETHARVRRAIKA